MNSWSTIQLHTNKLIGFLASIEMTNPSGVNEQNKVKIVAQSSINELMHRYYLFIKFNFYLSIFQISKATEAYLKVQNAAFRFDHCGNILGINQNGWNLLRSLISLKQYEYQPQHLFLLLCN